MGGINSIFLHHSTFYQETIFKNNEGKLKCFRNKGDVIYTQHLNIARQSIRKQYQKIMKESESAVEIGGRRHTLNILTSLNMLSGNNISK